MLTLGAVSALHAVGCRFSRTVVGHGSNAVRQTTVGMWKAWIVVFFLMCMFP